MDGDSVTLDETEVAAPIAQTGAFAGHPARPFLGMAVRKVRWMLDNGDRLAALATRSLRGG